MRRPKPERTRILLLLLSVLLLVGSAAFGEDDEDYWGGCDEPKTVIKKLRYLDSEAVPPILSALDYLRVRRVADSNAVIVTGCEARVELALEILQNLDEPPARPAEVEVVLYVLAAEQTHGEPPVPSALEGVVEELRGFFGYQHYSLLDTLLLRTVDRGAAGVTGSLGGAEVRDDGSGAVDYRLGFNRAEVFERETGPSVRLTGLEFAAGEGARLRTDVEVREGQKTVIGKARSGGEEGAYFLVLDARVLP